MGVKRPAEDDGEEGTSKAKVANLKKLEEEAKQHERDNPQQGTSRQMQGKGRTIVVYRVGRAPIVKFCRQFLICSSGRWADTCCQLVSGTSEVKQNKTWSLRGRPHSVYLFD